MFELLIDDELEVSDLDVGHVLEVAEDFRRTADRAEADLLKVAAHWADLHAVTVDGVGPGGHSPAEIPVDGMERCLPLAGPGTPEVAEFAPAELAAVLGLTTYAAHRLIGDALELRHRLPRLWQRVHERHLVSPGPTERPRRRGAPRTLQAWRARRIAAETLLLSEAAAGWVDEQVAPIAHSIGMRRVLAIVEAAVLRYDPEESSRRAAEAAEHRGVWLDEPARSGEGCTTIRIEADALDAAAFEATVDAIAERLAGDHGDTDRAQLRRAKAIGWLSDPAAALALLGDTGARSEGSDGAASPPARRRAPGATVQLYVHLSQDALTGLAATTSRGRSLGHVARVEGRGPVTVEQLAAWVSRALGLTAAGLGEGAPAAGAPITLRVTPVLDLADRTSVDAYEVPARMRESVLLRTPCCAFPWCDNLARSKDIDHVTPYLTPERGGPPGQTTPGQTTPGNLTPLCRRHHRLKTRGGWRSAMPEPGRHLWTSPLGRHYWVDHAGTLPLDPPLDLPLDLPLDDTG